MIHFCPQKSLSHGWEFPFGFCGAVGHGGGFDGSEFPFGLGGAVGHGGGFDGPESLFESSIWGLQFESQVGGGLPSESHVGGGLQFESQVGGGLSSDSLLHKPPI